MTMIRKQDIGVLIFYYLGYSRINNLILRCFRKPVTRILAFHDVLSKDLTNFETNLFFLKYKTNVISLDDFFTGRLATDKINTVITFDDGYKGWITHALPILQKLSLPATFFISSGFAGLSKDEEAIYIKTNLFRTLPPREITGSLKETDVKLLIDNGFTIGGHTVNHVDLAGARDIGQIKYEIAEDKRRLENIAGRNIQYFSYPTGAYKNPQISLTELLHEAGYKAAVTTKTGSNTTDTNPFLLRREITGAAMSHNVFKSRVYGNYDAINFLKQLMFCRSSYN